jgi:hypothetical protein
MTEKQAERLIIELKKNTRFTGGSFLVSFVALIIALIALLKNI